MEFAKPVAAVPPSLKLPVGTIDRIPDDIIRCVSVQNEGVNCLLAMGRQEDLNVQLDRKVVHQAPELHQKLCMDRVLEFVDEQHATTDAGEEQSDLEHTPHALAERREIRRLVKIIVTY